MAALALAGFKAAPPSKSPVGPIAFEDFEALEAGQSHEFVSPALLTPSPVPTPRRPNWVPCRVSRPRKDRFELRPVFSQHVTEYVLIASTQVELIELFVTPANGATQLRANRDLFEAEEGFNVSVAVSVESFHSLIQVDTLSQDGRNSITYTIKLQRHGVGVPKYGYDRPNQQRRPGMGRPGGPLINW